MLAGADDDAAELRDEVARAVDLAAVVVAETGA